LLGRDARAAEAALTAWATALAGLHSATRGLREAFRAALAERQGDVPVGESRVSLGLEDAVRVLDRACTHLEVRAPAGAFEELRALGKRLGGSGLAALTPADACPDNNVLTEAGRTTASRTEFLARVRIVCSPDGCGLVLVDFEGAQWRNVAWDVAYLRVPWPTCWCSWRMPDDVTDRAVAAYVAAAAPQLPEVTGPAFGRDVEAAVAGWALVSTALFIDNALGDDPPLNPRRPTPSRRAMILHRLGRAARTGELPGVAALAARLADALRGRWGEVPLALAPAFRAAQ
jgi:hypothetical protein